MIHIPSARLASGTAGFMLVLPLLLLTSCGSTPQQQPRPQQTPAAVVDFIPIELAAGVAPVFADEEEAGVRPATDGSSGTRLLQLHPTDSVGEQPTEEVVLSTPTAEVSTPTAEQIEAVNQALARAADARQNPPPPTPAPNPIEEIETSEVEDCRDGSGCHRSRRGGDRGNNCQRSRRGRVRGSGCQRSRRGPPSRKRLRTRSSWSRQQDPPSIQIPTITVDSPHHYRNGGHPRTQKTDPDVRPRFTDDPQRPVRQPDRRHRRGGLPRLRPAASARTE